MENLEWVKARERISKPSTRISDSHFNDACTKETLHSTAKNKKNLNIAGHSAQKQRLQFKHSAPPPKYILKPKGTALI